jgi:hypothetical protein
VKLRVPAVVHIGAARVIFQASPWRPRGPSASFRARNHGVYSYNPQATLFLALLSFTLLRTLQAWDRSSLAIGTLNSRCVH